MSKRQHKNINWDMLGITASILCAIHCALLPILLTSLPLFGINIIDNKAFEFGMIALAFIIGFIALRQGKTHHGSNVPIVIFSTGMLFLILKEIFHDYHIAFLIPAVIFILTAHFYNFTLCRNSEAHSKKA